MALSSTLALPQGSKLHPTQYELLSKGSSQPFFLGKKLYSNITNPKTHVFGISYKKPLIISNAIINNGTTILSNASAVAPAVVVTPPEKTPVPSPTEGADTMSVVLAPGLAPATIHIPDHVKRSDFPPDFIFGASTSALQTEGNGKEGGRAPSTWDSMIAAGGGNGMAVDSYSLYQDDVKLLKETGVTAYRFSISWSRILPYAGHDNTVVNQHGIDFYNNLINELLANGITPFVTLFHFDLPQTLQDKYGGFLDEAIIKDYTEYADICFKNFGDRVKNWITINEPYNFGSFGYQTNLPAQFVAEENSYVVTHNIILSHASIVDLYRKNYQEKQAGKIGISLSSLWFEPYDRKNGLDIKAQKQSLDFMLGWYMDPLVNGSYPKSMEDFVIGLPKFTPTQQSLVQGSYDFIGINYYTARYVKPTHTSTVDVLNGQTRSEYISQTVTNIDQKEIGPPAPQNDQIYVVPTGLRDLLLYVKKTYNNPEVYVTENGVPAMPTITASIRDLVATGNEEEIKAALLDAYRIKDISEHLYNLREALAEVTTEDGKPVATNVKGYFVWSLLDNMEVAPGGCAIRFGLNYVDYLDRHTRYQKASGIWYNHFLNSGSK